MAEYHVKLNKDCEILAGTLSKTGKWTNSSVVTAEALQAVRDHLLAKTAIEKKDICYAWNYNNGKTVILRLEEMDTNEIKNEE